MGYILVLKSAGYIDKFSFGTRRSRVSDSACGFRERYSRH